MNDDNGGIGEVIREIISNADLQKAFVAMIGVLVSYLWPNLPANVWQTIGVFISALLGVIGAVAVRKKVATARYERSLMGGSGGRK